MSVIKLSGVEKKYGEKVVFSGVNLEIPAGAFAVLRGESGAGKSTLLDLIAGLEQPTVGRIEVDGQDVWKMTPKARVEFYRHAIGIIFQGSYLQPQLTLRENIALPGVFAGTAPGERKAQVERLAGLLGITENLDFLPKEVSGGQAERACIARALLLSPKVILADEPTNNLDDRNAQIVLKILDVVRQKLGVTVVIASHGAEVLGLATQLITVAQGRVESKPTERKLTTSEQDERSPVAK